MSELLTTVLLDSAVFLEWARLQEAELQMATSTSGNSTTVRRVVVLCVCRMITQQQRRCSG